MQARTFPVCLPRRVLFSLACMLVLLAGLAWHCAAGAAVPNQSASPAYAEEQTILQLEKDVPEPGWGSADSGKRHIDRHYVQPPGNMVEQDIILQRGGNTWRHLRNGPLSTAVAGVLLLAVLAIALTWMIAKPAPAVEGRSGRKVQRFSSWDRLVHWTTAIVFILLAITGLIILFGKNLLLPIMGNEAFSWLAIASKYVHNVAGPLFVLLTILMFFTYLARNLPRRGDWHWLKIGGGVFSHQHVPAGFFNAGEKLWFWGAVTLLGIITGITGLMLDFTNLGFTRYLLQVANVLHLAATGIYMAFALGHIYIGTVGTPGAYRAMRDGDVDIEWAQAHHQYWYDEVMQGSSAAELPPGPLRPAPRS